MCGKLLSAGDNTTEIHGVNSCRPKLLSQPGTEVGLSQVLAPSGVKKVRGCTLNPMAQSQGLFTLLHLQAPCKSFGSILHQFSLVSMQ